MNKSGESMAKIDIMKKFMNTFVGNKFYLIIQKKEKHLIVKSIQVVQKTDDTCPIKEIPVGDYFFHLLTSDEEGSEFSFLCNWSKQFIQSLLNNYSLARKTGFSEIEICKNPLPEASNWLIIWGNELETKIRPKINGKEITFNTNRKNSVTLQYIS